MKVTVKRKDAPISVTIGTEFIKLESAMKLMNIVPSGGSAKLEIQEGMQPGERPEGEPPEGMQPGQSPQGRPGGTDVPGDEGQGSTRFVITEGANMFGAVAPTE